MEVGRPLEFDSVEQLEEKIYAYFSDCHRIRLSMMSENVDLPDDVCTTDAYPTLSGLALCLGVDRKTIYNYGKKDEFFPTIRNARAHIESVLEQRLFYQHCTGVIFNLKNNFDWKDKNEIDHRSGDGSMSPKEITAVDPIEAARQYQEIIGKNE